MKCFSLIRHFIPDAQPAPAFWPGDSVEADILESEEYKQVSKSRMEKLRQFLISGEFEESLIKACISSLPRWRYARELSTDPSKKTTDPDYDG